jgi:hypothetical protein
MDGHAKMARIKTVAGGEVVARVGEDVDWMAERVIGLAGEDVTMKISGDGFIRIMAEQALGAEQPHGCARDVEGGDDQGAKGAMDVLHGPSDGAATSNGELGVKTVDREG